VEKVIHEFGVDGGGGEGEGCDKRGEVKDREDRGHVLIEVGRKVKSCEGAEAEGRGDGLMDDGGDEVRMGAWEMEGLKGGREGCGSEVKEVLLVGEGFKKLELTWAEKDARGTDTDVPSDEERAKIRTLGKEVLARCLMIDVEGDGAEGDVLKRGKGFEGAEGDGFSAVSSWV
jgi:hypothetical protein